jgi:hypothetical protein
VGTRSANAGAVDARITDSTVQSQTQAEPFLQARRASSSSAHTLARPSRCIWTVHSYGSLARMWGAAQGRREWGSARGRTAPVHEKEKLNATPSHLTTTQNKSSQSNNHQMVYRSMEGVVDNLGATPTCRLHAPRGGMDAKEVQLRQPPPDSSNWSHWTHTHARATLGGSHLLPCTQRHWTFPVMLQQWRRIHAVALWTGRGACAAT